MSNQKEISQILPFPSSQDITYSLDSQYFNSSSAFALSHVFSLVRSKAFKPKMRSKPEQFAKANSRSTAYSGRKTDT